MSWFWSEWFWFPHDRPWGWKDLENKPGSNEYRPQLTDLHWAVLFGLGLILVRYLLDNWQLLFYTVFFIYGMAILSKKPYIWKTRLCWEEWPFQHVPNDLYWYYQAELAFYWSLIFTLFWDHRRKDFIEMTVHHVATIVLMYFSWILNLVRAGSLVLVVHDAADTWLSITRKCITSWMSTNVGRIRPQTTKLAALSVLKFFLENYSNFAGSQLAKLSIYLKKETLTDAFFGIFLVVWTISRLIIFPFVVLYCTTVEPYYRTIDTTFGGHIFLNAFLYLLQILHIFWSYLIFKAAIFKMIKGKVEDLRSDTEESDAEIEESETTHTQKNENVYTEDKNTYLDNVITISANGGSQRPQTDNDKKTSES